MNQDQREAQDCPTRVLPQPSHVGTREALSLSSDRNVAKGVMLLRWPAGVHHSPRNAH